MKKIVGILFFLAMILSFAPSAFADSDFQSGSGTMEDPYVITNLAQLQAVSSHTDAYFNLDADITEPLTTSLCGDGFTGNFNGNGHTVTLAITAEDPNEWLCNGLWIGMFGENGGTISNLNVTGYVTGSTSYVGAIAGENHGIITGCTSSATVTLSGDTNSSFTFWPSAGGIAGNNSGTISKCLASGTVTVDTGGTGLGYEIAAGGLIGLNDNGSGSDSSASGTVIVGQNNKDVNKGGLIGRCNVGSITNCSATGDVPASSTKDGADNQGGLIGYVTNSSTTISGCYATGDVTGGDSEGITRAGGLIGYDASLALVSNCYATGNVSLSLSYGGSLKAEAGGLVGYLTSSKVQNSYSVGCVTGGSVKGKNVFLGGLIGRVNAPNVTGCYWNTSTSGIVIGAGSGTYVGSGLTTAQMTGTAASTNMADLGFSTNFTAMENTALKWYYPQLTIFFSNGNTTSKNASLAGVTLTTPALSALNFSSGTIFPNFSSDTTDYAVAVGNSVSSITLTPSTTVPGATIKVNSTSVTNGSESGDIDVADANNIITITVLSSNGTYRNYKLTATKFTPVTGITNVPTTATTGTDLMLSGTVAPSNATNKTITWSVKDAGTSGATIISNKLSTTAPGTVTVTATITDGTASGTAYTQDFTIMVSKSSSSGGGSGSSSGGSSGGGRTSTTGNNSSITVTTDGGTTTAAQTFTASTGSNGVASASVTKDQITDMMKAASEKAQKQNTQTALEIRIDSGSAATGVSVTIPQGAASSLTHGVKALTVSSTVVMVTFDEKALAEIAKSATADIVITASKSDDTALSDEDKAIIGGRPVYDLKVTVGSTTISTFGGGTATVSVPYKPASGEDTSKVVVYYISGSGELIMVPDCVYDASTGTVIFKTTHFSSYAVGYNDVNFTDVSGWYETYVNYLAARGILNGTGDGKFSSHANITRAEFVTILANLSGDNLSGYTSSSCSDVASTDWYFAAAQWAYKNGIASGYDGKFSPNANITREQMAVMLYNYAKYAGINVSNVEGMSIREFSDYESISNWALTPIQWATNNSIVSGNSDGSFAPKAYATRAQAAKMIALLLQGTVK